MKNILIVMKKELKRFFTDRRMLSVLVLPGILIFVIYSIMGNLISSAFMKGDDYVYQVYTLNEPTEFSCFYNVEGMSIENHKIESESELEEIKEKIANTKADVLIIYEDNFMNKVNAYTDITQPAPQVKIFYNSSETSSYEMYNYFINALNSYEATLVNKYDINSDSTQFDLASSEAISKQLITILLPYLLVILLFSGCMSITPESIAGEKERGTIATLLVTPIKRSHLALGKIIALSLVTLVSATSSFSGILLSLPNLMSGMDIDVSMYGIGTYLAVFAVIISTELVFNAILSILSAFSKSVKEATNYAAPVMILVLVAGLSSMFTSNGITSNLGVFFVPVYNSVQCMSGVFAMSFTTSQLLITIFSNIVYFAIGVFVLAKMFNSEKIMFNN